MGSVGTSGREGRVVKCVFMVTQRATASVCRAATTKYPINDERMKKIRPATRQKALNVLSPFFNAVKIG